jgi:hypothetical protein
MAPLIYDQQTTHSSRYSIVRFIVTYRKPLITLKRSGGAGEKQRDAHNMSSY